MQVNHESFLNWCESRFDKVKCNGYQLQINSIFTEDSHFKLYCNTELNAYHCFKSENSGNLVKLVQIVENCSWEDALEIIGGSNDMHSLEQKVKELFLNKNKNEEVVKTLVSLPDNTFKIQEMHNENPFKKRAENYIKNRKIESQYLMVCCSGKYANRLIIPYYDQSNNLIYYNARAMGNNFPKYLFPDNLSVGKSDFIYVPEWKNQQDIFVCEGEINAITLSQLGFFSAATGGKEMSEKQVQLLKPYNIIMCYDNDNSGKIGTYKSAIKLMADNSFRTVKYVFPNYNDWNEFLIKTDYNIITKHINDNISLFDEIKFRNYIIPDYYYY